MGSVKLHLSKEQREQIIRDIVGAQVILGDIRLSVSNEGAVIGPKNEFQPMKYSALRSSALSAGSEMCCVIGTISVSSMVNEDDTRNVDDRRVSQIALGAIRMPSTESFLNLAQGRKRSGGKYSGCIALCVTLCRMGAVSSDVVVLMVYFEKWGQRRRILRNFFPREWMRSREGLADRRALRKFH